MLKHSGVRCHLDQPFLLGVTSEGWRTAVAQLINAFKRGIRIIETCSPRKFDYVRSFVVKPVDRNAA